MLTRAVPKPGLGGEHKVGHTHDGQDHSAPGLESDESYSNSVLTLYGLILAPNLNLFKLPFWVWGS